MEYFGVKLIQKKYSFELKKDEFAPINIKPSLPWSADLARRNAYTDESTPTVYSYRIEWCEKYRELCLKNYDLNMAYFDSLDGEEFNLALQNFLHRYRKFQEVRNLQDYDGIEGYYLLILDRYKQAYIGKTFNIKRRILQHWSKVKDFDRTLLPMYAVKKSCFSIDFFRALDTTRIFAWKKEWNFTTESRLIRAFPKKFLTNRIGGDAESNPLQALSINRRKL